MAQTVETIPFRAVLSPLNEVPPITDLNASGAATIWVHVVRDAEGEVESGSVDFNVDYTFPGEVTLTGLHIHSGAAGVNGPVRISSGLTNTPDPDGRGSLRLQGQVGPADAVPLEHLRALLEDPSQYYVNLHTTVHPAGAIRGQLEPAEMLVLMGLMSPQNEVPPVDVNASGVANVIVLRTENSGHVTFDVDYTFPGETTFTGLHIHTGRAGVNGPVTISSGLQGPLASDPSGSGNLHFEAEVNMENANAVQTLNGLFEDPSAFYINLHTSQFPGGAIRAQLRNTDTATFQISMQPTPAGLQASAPAAVTLHTLRDPDGTIPAGVVTFDVNPRFPAGTEFQAMHIHTGAEGVDGPVVIDSRMTAFTSEGGAANIFSPALVRGNTALQALNSLVAEPANFYVNLHTTAHPAGAVRAQLAEATTAAPVVESVVSAIGDPEATTVAPGGLIILFGNNLTQVEATLAGFEGDDIPTSMNGTRLTLGGEDAPILSLAPTHIVAQVPVEAAPGARQAVVTTAVGASQAFDVTVASAAPAIFFDEVGGIVSKNDDFTLVDPENPAEAGDLIVIWSTGLGQTDPPLTTGRIVTFPPPSNTEPVTVSIGGQDAEVLYSIASPGFVGLYQTVVRVPTGVTAGNAPLVLRVGDAESNTVDLAVR